MQFIVFLDTPYLLAISDAFIIPFNFTYKIRNKQKIVKKNANKKSDNKSLLMTLFNVSVNDVF